MIFENVYCQIDNRHGLRLTFNETSHFWQRHTIKVLDGGKRMWYERLKNRVTASGHFDSKGKANAA